METRPLGRSKLVVSRVGLGCNNFGMKLGIDETRRVIDAALDAGINFFDTADMYGGTKSEEFMGAAFAGRRERALIATKFGALAMMGKTGERWGSREYVRKAVEASLARLRTDVIDLYQMHFPDAKTPVEETLGALAELVREGKLRAIGCSNFTGPMLDAAEDAARASGGPRFETAQNEWSLLVRKAEGDVIPACEKHGVSQLPYFPLASGMLSGKYRKGEPLPAGSRLAGGGSYFDAVKTDANFEKVEKLRAFAEGRGRSVLELAISWLAAQPSVGSVIAGATSPEQVHANAKAASWKLTSAELAEIDRLAPR
jgi:aryl-alcohol dehydrogenase-like predicted oxidoreductase